MFKNLIIRIGQVLNTKTIPYMIIGGQAVILYGEPRLTRDIDITLGAGIESLPEFLDILKNLALKPLPENLEQFVKQTMVLPAIDDNTKIRVDFIFSFTEYEQQAIGRARKVLMDNVEINFASPEDVIIHKCFAHRPRDLEDIRGILLKKPELDVEYMKKWLKEFDRAIPEEHFTDTLNILLDE